MRANIRENIIRILKKTLNAITRGDIKGLKDLSNRTIHSASIFQDMDSVSVAVLVYSISKIFERSKYRKYRDWRVCYDVLVNNLKKAEKSLEKGDIKGYEESIKKSLSVTRSLGGNLKKYVRDVIERARIAKGSRVHEHGVSIGRTASLLGVSEWDLMEYVGRTGISDVKEAKTKPVKERLKFIRSLF